MVRRSVIILAILAAASANAAERPLRLLDGASPGARIQFTSGNRIADAWGLALDDGPDIVAAARRIASENALLLFGSSTPPDLRILDIRESLTGTHVRMQQTIDGIDVIGGTFTVDFDHANHARSIHNRIASRDTAPAAGREPHALSIDVASTTEGRPVLDDRVVYLNVDGVARLARRIVVAVDEYRSEARYVGAGGEILMTEPLWFAASSRVFDPNPVTRTGDTTLHDQNDAAAAVPESAYSDVDLPGVGTSGRLIGPNVTIIDVESPTTEPAELSKSLVFNRFDDQFEEVMAYYHLDRSQRYIQSLGFTGAKSVIGRSIRVDAHGANGADNSYYRIQGGEGSLFFGDGGVDDAEDPDILLHEYGHAIHDSIAPGAFTGSSASQGRALGEAFGDYWAFSSGYAASIEFGGDPYCVGEWDARCADGSGNGCEYPTGATCLRRVDGTKTMADYISSNRSGTEHANGEIFSSALREIFDAIVERNGVDEGRRIADRLILESLFGLPNFTSFETTAMSILETDQILDGSDYQATICTAMVNRAILPSSACAAGPRGEFLAFPAAGRDIPIALGSNATAATRDVDVDGLVRRVRVHVEIDHPRRGDLRVSLVAPGGGTRVVLHAEGSDAAANIVATYGLDTPSDESLDALRGLPARGLWTLEVLDTGTVGGGVIRSWDLSIEVDGTAPIASRPASADDSLHVLAVANVAGAEGTRFVSDLSIRNTNDDARELTLFFTPSGTDGSSSFRAVRLSIAGGQSVTIPNVVVREFETVGVGNLEIEGDLDGVIVTSRNYNNASAGTYGQFIGAVATSEGIGLDGPVIEIPQIEVDSGFRSNLGVTELSGTGGTIEVTVFDDTGAEIDRVTFGLAPWSHLQIPLLSGKAASAARAEVRVIAGGARVAAYGSVVDNRSGDPIYIAGRPLDTTARSWRVPAAANVPGALSTRWRTDLWLTNPTSSDVLVTVRFLPSAGGTALAFDANVPKGGIVAIPDVVGSRFGLDPATGQIEVSSSPLIVTSRTWNENENGTYGQFVAGTGTGAAIGKGDGSLSTIGLTLSDEFRTNVGVVSVDGNDAIAHITILDDAGDTVRDVSVYVPANGQVQFGIGQIGISSLRDGVARFEIADGGGRLVAYAVVIDNRSSDPTYVPASHTP